VFVIIEDYVEFTALAIHLENGIIEIITESLRDP
jgi:hypothetical protein